MAKMSLAVKYRPKTFDDIVEQDVIKQILQYQISTKTHQNAYLFCGPAGCGKTTAARIFANDINEGKGNPIEIDAASNNGVDNIRDIIVSAGRKSLDSEYKVYIMDECHMLSKSAWNAMLKLLEEPPAGTVFILCTTDPHKVPDTILSRVQRFDFTRMSVDSIVERLLLIVCAENDNICEFAAGYPDKMGMKLYYCGDGALRHIAKLANGGMRDAITMLDKCLSISKHLTLDEALKILGVASYDVYFDLLSSLTTYYMRAAIGIIESAYLDGKNLRQFMQQFQYFVLDVCKFHLFGNFNCINIPQTSEYTIRLKDEDIEDCLRLLDWCIKLNADLKYADNPKYMIEGAIMMYCMEETQ